MTDLPGVLKRIMWGMVDLGMVGHEQIYTGICLHVMQVRNKADKNIQESVSLDKWIKQLTIMILRKYLRISRIGRKKYPLLVSKFQEYLLSNEPKMFLVYFV